jgi:hypothetical protein
MELHGRRVSFSTGYYFGTSIAVLRPSTMWRRLKENSVSVSRFTFAAMYNIASCQSACTRQSYFILLCFPSKPSLSFPFLPCVLAPSRMFVWVDSTYWFAFFTRHNESMPYYVMNRLKRDYGSLLTHIVYGLIRKVSKDLLREERENNLIFKPT